MTCQCNTDRQHAQQMPRKAKPSLTPLCPAHSPHAQLPPQQLTGLGWTPVDNIMVGEGSLQQHPGWGWEGRHDTILFLLCPLP